MNRNDFIAGMILITISVIMFLDTYTFPITPVQGAGPAFWPRLLSVLLIILSVILIIRSFVGKEGAKYAGKVNFKPFAGILISVSYFLLFKKVGFIVTTFAYFCGLSLLAGGKKAALNTKNLVLMILQSALLLGIVYFVFKIFLRVNLPKGILF